MRRASAAPTCSAHGSRAASGLLQQSSAAGARPPRWAVRRHARSERPRVGHEARRRQSGRQCGTDRRHVTLIRPAAAADDAAIARCRTWIAHHYRQPAPVTAMVQLSGLPERSFERRFQLATGMSPLEYVHTLRLEEAKQMLESTDSPIEAIANEVGYEDAGFFSRLFRRQVALTPAQYRKRFGAMRSALTRPLPPEGGSPCAVRAAGSCRCWTSAAARCGTRRASAPCMR
jgi:AraC-like DNA-binding protein